MKNIVVSLVYDSWLEPIPELRSTDLKDRHLIYEGGGIILDLLLRTEGDDARIHIGGQVLPDDSEAASVSDVQILMEQGARRSCTHTNALGEFSFRAVPNRTLDLAIILKDRRFLVRGLSNNEPRMWRVVSSAGMSGGVQ